VSRPLAPAHNAARTLGTEELGAAIHQHFSAYDIPRWRDALPTVFVLPR